MASRPIGRTDTWRPTEGASNAAMMLRYLKGLVPPARIENLLSILRDIGIPTTKAEAAVAARNVARQCMRCELIYFEYENHPEACRVLHSLKCDKDTPFRINCAALCPRYAGAKGRHTTQHPPIQVVKVNALGFTHGNRDMDAGRKVGPVATLRVASKVAHNAVPKA
ncbi:hypothetical protein BDN71DRAFT_1513123 [Pleurotus eryngii]|uniref:Uncharacterized protein n=1 Tax=Pleurotus eryngii TaxID=5323 RepID=A0A9P6D2A1_PLEER|nr:hypothetical protein BDN71DRAFT_1513123 [Pleurotus eryngii]